LIHVLGRACGRGTKGGGLCSLLFVPESACESSRTSMKNGGSIKARVNRNILFLQRRRRWKKRGEDEGVSEQCRSRNLTSGWSIGQRESMISLKERKRAIVHRKSQKKEERLPEGKKIFHRFQTDLSKKRGGKEIGV